jgi:carbon monoxide dehydrogenase subunit G
MKLTGTATLAASPERVYAALQDPAVLVRTLPGCQRLEAVGGDSYRATVVAGVAAVKGTFDGAVRLADHEPPHAFTLHASGAGAPGTISAVARVRLAPADGGGTVLTYDADATIGGVLGGVGQRMITGVAGRTATEFFHAVDRALAEPSPSADEPEPLFREEEFDELRAAPPAPTGVWTAPAPAVDPARQRMRDLLVGAVVGAVIAIAGVIVGAIVAGW